MLAQILENPEIIKDVNILITDSGHIPRTSCLRHFSFGTPKFILNENKQVIRSGYCNFGIADDIPLPRIFGSIINRSMIKNKIHGLFKKKNYYDEDNVELYLSIIKKIDELINNKEKKFFVGFMNSTSKLDKKLIQILKTKKINIIDLSLDINNEEYWLFDGHTTEKGNKKRAEIIGEYLNNLN